MFLCFFYLQINVLTSVVYFTANMRMSHSTDKMLCYCANL